MTLFSFGLGVGTKNSKGAWLEVFYPTPLLQPGAEISALAEQLGYRGGNQVLDVTDLKQLATLNPAWAAFANSTQPVVAVCLATDSVIQSVPEAYLKLQLLSQRLVKPHGLNLGDLFKVLPTVAWTNRGAIDPDELPARQLAHRLRGEVLSVDMVDKFPKMSDYTVGTGLRIADCTRVRLGAYLGSGTTVMQEGFINFNAGTEGPNMVEGRISAGVMVGAGSDLGGGCSTMGTLSGGNSTIISVGQKCLLGANAGLGIPLGDQCTVEAGLYLTATSKVKLYDSNHGLVGQVKARELAGRSGLLFRRNSLDGSIECLPNKNVIALNKTLHATP